MFPFTTAKVILSQNAYQQIKHSVAETGNQYEVGGILLGHKMRSLYFVVATTVPTEVVARSIVSFVLDGSKHTEHALKIMRHFQHEPLVLGAWHSHICDAAIFSEQDRQSNKQLAASLNGTLSMIATMPIQKLNLVTYFIATSGKEYRCQTIVDLNNKKIPSCYIKQREGG